MVQKERIPLNLYDYTQFPFVKYIQSDFLFFFFFLLPAADFLFLLVARMHF